MDVYLIGNLLGRLAISYALVWAFVWLAFSRGDWRAAFRRTHRWYGITSVTAVFVAGVLVAMKLSARP